MDNFVRALERCVEAINKVTPHAIALLSLVVALSVIWLVGGK